MIVSDSDKNDPFEEFEFRPINEGLGFHSRNKTIAAPQTPQAPKTFTVSNGSTAATSASPFQTALPRLNNQKQTNTFQIPSIEDDSISKAQTAVNEILKNLNQKRQLDFISDTENERAALKKSKPQLFAAVLDSMLIIAAFLMTLILMLSITKVDMILNLTHAETSSMVYLSTLALLFSVTFIYMVVNRAFLGFTPGEWAFDQQCGEVKQQNSFTYIPKIALRTILVIATGFVTLPFLSYLFNKDIAGNLSGISLFKKPFGS